MTGVTSSQIHFNKYKLVFPHHKFYCNMNYNYTDRLSFWQQFCANAEEVFAIEPDAFGKFFLKRKYQ